MKQKKHNDKRRNINNVRNKRTAYVAYKRINRATKDYQKSNYDNQTDNKDNNVNIDMSMGLGEKKKIKSEPVDQKDEKPSSPEAITTPSPPLSTPPTLQPEIFDSYRYNAMSEMKEIADMGPDNTSKVFSHVEEKRQLDPSIASINDSVKKTDPENSLNTNPETTGFPAMANSTLEVRDSNAMESEEEDAVSKQDVKSNIPQVDKESEKQDHLGDSVRFYDNEKQETHFNSLNIDNNPFVSIIKVWQDYTVAWINVCNEFMKGWKGMNKS
jgi:hypothetical protein